MDSEDTTGIGCLLLFVVVIGWATYALWNKAELLERLRTEEAISGAALVERGTIRTKDFDTPGVLAYRSWCEREVSSGEDTHTEYTSRYRDATMFRLREPSGAEALVLPGVVVMMSVPPHITQGRPGGWSCYEIVIKPGDRVTVVGDLERVGLDRRLSGELSVFRGTHKEAERQLLDATTWRIWVLSGVNLVLLLGGLMWLLSSQRRVRRRWSELFNPLHIERHTRFTAPLGELLHRTRRGMLEELGPPQRDRMMKVLGRLVLLPFLGVVVGLIVWLESPTLFLLIERVFAPEGLTLAATRYGAMVAVGGVGVALMALFTALRVESPWERLDAEDLPPVEEARDAFVQLAPWIMPLVEPEAPAELDVATWDRWAGVWTCRAPLRDGLSPHGPTTLTLKAHCRSVGFLVREQHTLEIQAVSTNNAVSKATHTWTREEAEADPRPIGLRMAERLQAWLDDSDLHVRTLRLGELARDTAAARLTPAAKEPAPTGDDLKLAAVLRHEMIRSPHPDERPTRRAWTPALIYVPLVLVILAMHALLILEVAVAPLQPNTLVGTMAVTSLVLVLSAFYAPRLQRAPRETLLMTSPLRLERGRLTLGEAAIPLLDALEAGGLAVTLTRSPESIAELALLGVEVTDTSAQPPVRLRWRVPVRAEDVAGLPELDLRAPLMDAADFVRVWPALRWYASLGGERLPEAHVAAEDPS